MRLESPHSSSSSSSSSSPAPITTRFPNPSQRWPRHSGERTPRDRLSTSVSRLTTTGSQTIGGHVQDLLDTGLHWLRRGQTIYETLRPLQRALLFLAGCVLAVLALLFLLYSEALFKWLAGVSETWRAIPAGWLINVLLIVATSVPPIIGYSTAVTVAGFVYGFPLGWPVAASATVVGSLLAFVACRTVLSSHVHGSIGNDHRFVALGQVLRRDGLVYLTGIRFCPLPFSLSNGFLATVPSITPAAFAMSTAMSTPKLLIHVFIGSQMAVLAEKGGSMSLRDRLINYASIAVGVSIGAVVGFAIYRRTLSRAAELAQEEALAGAEDGLGGHGVYEDTEETTLMDPEDAADLMGDDDVSLWSTQMDDEVRDTPGGKR